MAEENIDIDKNIVADEPSFIDSVPEAYREKDYMKDIDSMDKLVEQFDNAQKLIGKKTLGVPTEESSIDEWNEFFNKMGRPEAHDGYEFELPELPKEIQRSDQDLDMMKKIFHEAGLTKKQANEVLKRTDEAVLAAFEGSKESYDKMVEARNKEFMDSIEKHFGAEKDQAIAVSETMLKKFVPKGMEDAVKALDDQSMLVLSTVLNNIHKSGRLEDKIDKDVTTVQDQNPESLRETAKKLMMSAEFKDAFHPNHDSTKKKVQDLYQKIASAQK